MMDKANIPDRRYVVVLVTLIFLLCFHLLPKVKERIFFFLIGEPYSKYEWQNVNTIRQWVSTNTPSSSDTLSIREKLWRNSPYQILLKFSFQQGGVDCAGYSYVLMKLYKEFGYTAFSYHSGKLSAFNHVVTLVEISYKGEKKLVIQDASYDATYVDANMEPLPFSAFLRLIEAKQYDRIHILEGGAPPHLYICDLVNERKCRTNSIKDGPITTHKGRKVFYEKLGINTIEANKHIYLYPRLIQTMDDSVFHLSTISQLEEVLSR